MKMIQFKDELVPLKQCKIGTVVGFDLPETRIFYGHITGFTEDYKGNLMLVVLDLNENTINWYPSSLSWNI
jgi:hypothetical protein